MPVESRPFGATPDGQPVQRFECRLGEDLSLSLTNYGAIVVAVETPDRDGRVANLNAGFDELSGYFGGHPHYGGTIGRYANRIAGGKFTLDGREYPLEINNGPNHLHGGSGCFDRRVWDFEVLDTADEAGVRFTRVSSDGEEGYPGALSVSATYAVRPDGVLRMEFRAETDQPTVLNLCNHNYWNLRGDADSVAEHLLTLHCDRYLPVDATLIPTGELAEVADTPLDFRQQKPIGRDWDQLGGAKPGYDHCFVVRGEIGALRPAAEAIDPASGRAMEVWTTQPGVQLYTANFLDGSPAHNGRGGHSAFCLETQHFPDSPNRPEFPTTVLRPGESFLQITEHRFRTA